MQRKNNNIKHEIFVGDKKIELDEKGEYQGDTFKVSTRYGQPLFSGLNFTGSIDEVLAEMSKTLK